MNTGQGDDGGNGVLAHVARRRTAGLVQEWPNVDPCGHDVPASEAAHVGLVVTVAIEADGDVAARHLDHRRGPHGADQARLVDARLATLRQIRDAADGLIGKLYAQRIVAAEWINKGR